MRTSAPGSKSKGFTLIELMVVVTLIAIATALVGLSLRDPQQAQLAAWLCAGAPARPKGKPHLSFWDCRSAFSCPSAGWAKP
jgi:prepilin-type N-terminal cleavage/methylation domain-containing protein